MMTKPLIGLTCYSSAGPDWAQHSPGHYMDFVFRDYPRGVEAAGGTPVLLPVMKDMATVRSAVARLDGLLLTGGHDVAPRLYGQEPRVGIREMDYDRDLMEIEAVKEAERRGLPILGICRGIQLLAAAFGGTLYQDIFRETPDCLDHTQKAGKRVNTHKVKVEKSSKLYRIVGAETIWVNSNHHQAVKDPPADFVVTARAADGIIEAMERPDDRYLLGVQWHPEGTWREDEASMKIFGSLVEAARKRLKDQE